MHAPLCALLRAPSRLTALGCCSRVGVVGIHRATGVVTIESDVRGDTGDTPPEQLGRYESTHWLAWRNLTKFIWPEHVSTPHARQQLGLQGRPDGVMKLTDYMLSTLYVAHANSCWCASVQRHGASDCCS